MRILIIGSGGREHAIAWSLLESPSMPEVFVAPGNGGTSEIATNLSLQPDDRDGLLHFVRQNDVGLVIIGPEQPLVDGLADYFREFGIPVVGPSAQAAQLEGSKAFSKAFMQRHAIPTAAYTTFDQSEHEAALAFVQKEGAPIVIKASGLAAGKGAIVCTTLQEAEAALRSLMIDHDLGQAADEVVIESFMEGEEVSIFVLTDGKDYVTLAPAQDHKRIGDGDTGPNTGGMGAYAPAPVMTAPLFERVRREIIDPTLHGMKSEGYPFQGILYVGLMITQTGPKVVEYNCRFGDPETQVVLPLMKADAVEVFNAMAIGGIKHISVETKPGASACVVMASGGYPGPYEKGNAISGVSPRDSEPGNVHIFHAGTRIGSTGKLETNGGRVLAVEASASSLQEALEAAYARIGQISFKGAQYRKDIGQKGLNR